MSRARRSLGSGLTPRGVCSVCRTMQRLLMASGKVALHGKSKEKPRGCDGGYQRPVRVDGSGRPVDGGTVVGWNGNDVTPGPTARGGPDVEEIP